MVIPLTPVRFFEYAEKIFSAKEGVVCEEKRFTYGGFCSRVRKMSNTLVGLGAKGSGWLTSDTTATASWNFSMLPSDEILLVDGEREQHFAFRFHDR